MRKYTQLRTRQNIMLSDNLQYAACKQSHFRVKIHTLATLSV